MINYASMGQKKDSMRNIIQIVYLNRMQWLTFLTKASNYL